MAKESELSLYCIVNVADAPIPLIRKKETGAFYYRLPVPIQEQLVIFCEGNWEGSEAEYTVGLSYKDDVIELGKITNSSRCLLWKRAESTLPDSMTNEEENGLAKLLVEKSDSENPIEGVETTDPGNKIKEEIKNNVEKPQKKRKKGLKKDEKTPIAQAAKKQKMKEVPTRLRTGKEDGEIRHKALSPTIKNNMTVKCHKSLTKMEVYSSQMPEKLENNLNGKASTEQICSNSNNLIETVANNKNCDCPKFCNHNGTKQGKLTLRSNTENLNNDKSEESDVEEKQSEKSIRQMSDTEKKADVLEVTALKSKRARKTKKGNQMESIASEENRSDSLMEGRNTNVNKENVQFDSNIPVSETSLKSDFQKMPGKEVKESLPSGKAAICKDLTLRVLDRPSGRWGHSLCFVNRNMSVLIGGQGEKQQITKDSVWTLDCETRRWKDPQTEAEGQKPEYRMGHTATYDPLVRCIYVFGGSKNTRWFHDVHILDIENWKWQLVKANGKAPTRAYHSATLYRHELWIFGGVYPRPDPQPDGCSNEVHIFSPVMENWYSPIVSGKKPIPRSGHSATLINDQLVVFGGWDAPISYNDLHVLDMSIVEWSQLEVSGTPPSPRSWHASCALSGNRLLIHGGYNGDVALDDTHIFQLDDMRWIRIYVENQPTARVGHKALCMPYRHDNEEEDEVIIFGGGDNDGAYFDDLYSIYVPFQPANAT